MRAIGFQDDQCKMAKLFDPRSYAYDGTYPQDHVDKEFCHWRGIVGQFIQDLENAGSPVRREA